jgi:acetylornithine deacetylase/succinyl-diaminopimelate desuccinylase-like protein
MNPSRALSYAQSHRARFVSELKEFVRFPTVSSQPKHTEDIRKCAHWLAAHLLKIGLARVKVISTRGNPIVYAASSIQSIRPTILIYGHYDVVSAEPLKDWRTAPFQPTILGEKFYARGASDDKGQLLCHIKAIESYLKSGRRLPVNIKCLFEGEEEIGSPHLKSFIEQYKNALQADTAVISDTSMLAPDRPAISYSQRGGLRAEVEVTGPSHDLHSGNFGGAVHNPLQVLCEMVARLHGPDGRVAIPGFYDDVRSWGEDEREYMKRVGPGNENILQRAGADRGWGEPGFSAYERTTIRPALTVSGITGGHQAPGVKNFIPSRAVAKLSFRLVPDQDPARIAQLFRDHIARITPSTVQSTVRTFSAIRPALLKRNHPVMRAAAVAYRQGFGHQPVFVRSGGSIPVVNLFQDILGISSVLMGFGLPDDHIHGPSERLHLPNFYRGIATSIWFMTTAGKLKSTSRVERKKEAANF